MEGWSERKGLILFFFFQAEDGIRGLVRSRGLGDVYKRQAGSYALTGSIVDLTVQRNYALACSAGAYTLTGSSCLLYTSDAADDLLCVDLGGRRFIKKKKRSPDLLVIH